MAIGFDYCCSNCSHRWTLLSKRFTLGPVQWGETKYTCFSCQTFLAIAITVDANSWSMWLRKHEHRVRENPILSELADAIDARVGKQQSLRPIALDFEIVPCPTCHNAMSTVPFGEHLMKCPICGEFAGEFDDSQGISSYGGVEP